MRWLEPILGLRKGVFFWLHEGEEFMIPVLCMTDEVKAIDFEKSHAKCTRVLFCIVVLKIQRMK